MPWRSIACNEEISSFLLVARSPYELEAVSILRALLRVLKGPEALKVWYEGFKERHGSRPTALEAHHSGYAPRSVRKSHGSWLGFVRELGDLSDEQRAALGEGPAGDFLRELEITPMTKSYKMLLLLAMLNADKLPGPIGIDELVRSFARLARRNAVLRADVGDSLEDPVRLRQHLEKNPIEAWAGGRGTSGTRYFVYGNGALRTTFDVEPEHRQAFQELVREIADWRLGEYLDRGEGSLGVGKGLVCKVSHSSGRPILFLPDRSAHPEMPTGWTDVSVEGKPYQANFVKIAVNVLREPENPENKLPELMRRWFGPDAGLPGTNSYVVLEKTPSGWELKPQRLPEPPPGS